MSSPNLRAVLAAAVALAACGETGREPEPLRVATRSGGTVDVSRTTWRTACAEVSPAEGPVQSRRSLVVHGEDGVVTYADQAFGQPACAGDALDAPSSGSVSFLAFADGTKTTGWSGTPLPEHPAAPVATRALLETQVGFFGDTYWVDDVASPRVFYLGAANSPSSDGYPDLLAAEGYVEIQ